MSKLFFVAACLGAVSLSQASLITNGSFEEPFTSTWGYYQNGQVPGWRTTDGDNMEVGLSICYYVTAARDLNVLELDSNRNIALMQDVNLTSGAYELSFLSAKRGAHLDGRPSDTCDFEVLWNNQLVARISPTNTEMLRRSYQVTGLNGRNTLMFRAAGTSDGMGAILDDVNLNPVPEPATFAVLLGFPLWMKRRK